MHNIFVLPDEVFVNIFQYLTYSDLQTVRQVCKKFYELSLQPEVIRNDILIVYEDENALFLINITRPFKSLKFIKVIFTTFILDLFEKTGEFVTDLALIECDIDNNDFNTILRTCNNLVSLTLTSCRTLLMNISFDKSADVTTLTKLKNLTLNKCNYLTDCTLKWFLRICPNVVSLNLEGTEICFHSGLCRRFYTDLENVYDRPSNLVLTIYFIQAVLKERVQTIKALNISHTNIDRNCLQRIMKIEGLTLSELYVRNCNQLTHTLEIGSLQPSIVYLDLRYCKSVNDDTLRNICCNMPKLNFLNIEFCPVTDSGIVHLSGLKFLKTLIVTKVSTNVLAMGLTMKLRTLQTESLNFIPDSNIETALRDVVQLDLSHSTIQNDDLKKILKSCTKLLSFKLVNCRNLSDEGFFDMDKNLLNNLKGLQCLDLGSVEKITDKVFGFDLPDLRRINLYGVQISSIGLYSLAWKCKSIEHLNLTRCNVDDNAVIYCIKNLKRLEYLYLKFCMNITNEITDYISENKRSFRELDMSDCRFINRRVLEILDESKLVRKLVYGSLRTAMFKIDLTETVAVLKND